MTVHRFQSVLCRGCVPSPSLQFKHLPCLLPKRTNY